MDERPGENMDRKYLRQWLLTSCFLLLLGFAAAYDLYTEHRRYEAVEYDRLKVQARVCEETLPEVL